MRRRILIVDDNLDLADNLAELLEEEGYAVTTAGSGDEALALAGRGEFDTILSDVRMPGMSGVELVQRLSARNPRANFLLMTAYSSEAALGEAARAGVRTILHKPLDLTRLLERLPRSEVHVLVIEDDAEFAGLVSDSLRGRGYRCAAALTAAEGRRLLDAEAPDVAVIDVGLPDGDGVALAHVVCAERIPVVVISGHPEEAAPRLQALPGPWARVLGKPFGADALVAALRALVPSAEP